MKWATNNQHCTCIFSCLCLLWWWCKFSAHMPEMGMCRPNAGTVWCVCRKINLFVGPQWLQYFWLKSRHVIFCLRQPIRCKTGIGSSCVEVLACLSTLAVDRYSNVNNLITDTGMNTCWGHTLYDSKILHFYGDNLFRRKMSLRITVMVRGDSRFAPSQWETALLCNDVSHWLGASLESALNGQSECARNRPQFVHILSDFDSSSVVHWAGIRITQWWMWT